MSGLEVAGLLLGVFPLIITGLEQWRNTAKVGGFFWRIRSEYNECQKDVLYHELLFKQHLKRLLLPILKDADEVNRLVGDPNDESWGNLDLQERIKTRLRDTYDPCMHIIHKMNVTATELKKELSLDMPAIQSKLAPPDPKKHRQTSSSHLQSKTSVFEAAKSKWDYETFRLKFSFNDQVRKELFDQLSTGNQRLGTLLNTSDKMFKLQSNAPSSTKLASTLEAVFKKACRKSDLLFKALQNAWQCTCQQNHFANLRLEHRTLPQVCFEVILMFATPSPQLKSPWLWRELLCDQLVTCSAHNDPLKLSTASQTSQPIKPTPVAAKPSSSVKRKEVAFKLTTEKLQVVNLNNTVDPNFKLCELLCMKTNSGCMGIIGHDDETYHLHPLTKRKKPDKGGLLKLDHVLSNNAEKNLTRRQRYFVALLLASSVAQLQFTPWLRTGLTKEDIVFFPSDDDSSSIPYDEPFVRQSFSPENFTSKGTEVDDRNFYSLGILLLELCFGQRLEDHPLRKQYAASAGVDKQIVDLAVALKWAQVVDEEAGNDYASAVKWCFTTGISDKNSSWRGEIIRNVIRPLEACQQHFKAAAIEAH